jgi:uncharacterized membrane protein
VFNTTIITTINTIELNMADVPAVAPIAKVFPYSTVAIIAILMVFKYDRLEEMLQVASEYMETDRNTTIAYTVVAVFVLMLIMQGIWTVVYFIQNKRKAAAAAELMYTKERNALIAIFNSLDGKQWRDKTRWCSDEPIEKWKGVKVDRETGRVNKLLLADNCLGGKSIASKELKKFQAVF